MSTPDALLVMHITQARETINIGPCNEGFKHLRLLEYKITGHDPLIPLFFRFRNQSTIPVHGNVGHRYPLIFVADSANSGHNPNWMGHFDVSGSHQFNDAKILEIEIENLDGSNATFGSLLLVFEGFHHHRHSLDIYSKRGAEELTHFDLPRFMY